MLETKILAFSGKKGSGKNTGTNFILGSFMKSLELVQGDFKILPSGQLFVPDILGDVEHQGIFDITSRDENMLSFRKDYLDDFIRVYSFAEILKRDVCMKVLGLTEEQCFGTDDQKNTPTNLNWKDMPGVVWNDGGDLFNDITKHNAIDMPPTYGKLVPYNGRIGKYYDHDENGQVVCKEGEDGIMSARQVMQFVGTEIFRKMYNNVWVDALIRQIKDERPLMAVITDARFVNEVEGVIGADGKVIRLSRQPFTDNHASETALDDYPVSNYLGVVPDNLTIEEQNQYIKELLVSVSWFPQLMPSN